MVRYLIFVSVLLSFSSVNIAAAALTVQGSESFEAKKTKKPVKKEVNEGFLMLDPGVY